MQKVGSASPHPVYQHSPSPRYHPHSQREDVGDVEYEPDPSEERPVHRMMLPKSNEIQLNEDNNESSNFPNETGGSEPAQMQEDKMNNFPNQKNQEGNRSPAIKTCKERNNNTEASQNRTERPVYSSDNNKDRTETGTTESVPNNYQRDDIRRKGKQDETDNAVDTRDEKSSTLQKEDADTKETDKPPNEQSSDERNDKESNLRNEEDKDTNGPLPSCRFEERQDKIHRDIWNQPNPRSMTSLYGKYRRSDAGELFEDQNRVHIEGEKMGPNEARSHSFQKERRPSHVAQQRFSITQEPLANMTFAGIMSMTVMTNEFGNTDAELMLERERLARLKSETARLHAGTIPKDSGVVTAQSELDRLERKYKEQANENVYGKEVTITIPIVIEAETDLNNLENSKQSQSQRLHNVHDNMMQEIRSGSHLDAFDK